MKSPIIGIGASAGGLEAITELLSALPDRLGAALVIVQHLDRTHQSLLSEILRRRTPMPVAEAADGVAALPDHVYVIPPNVTLTVSVGVLRLSPRALGREIHKPVDALFRSLATDCGEAAVGIVLSGADSDGSAGIQAIKQSGGITFAQLPESARVPSMPKSAIDTQCVDFVLAPGDIARELQRLAGNSYWQTATATAVATVQNAAPQESETEPQGYGEALQRVFQRLREVHGVDFGRYKSSTLRRRLARRMALQRVENVSDYVAYLESNADEASALYQDFLIRVTSFFRDPESFQVLAEQVFPALRTDRAPKEPIRIWVPGCATGEEVYSTAIALLESMGDEASATGIQIFGTDVSEASIDKCRAGVYGDSIAQDVSAERLRRFFVKQDSHYVISRAVRDLCVFARHDITRDPPYSRLDLVSCRNLLIYLGVPAQIHVLQVFRYALRSNGFLILGPSESVGQGEEFFESVDKQHRLYRLRARSRSTHLNLAARQEGGATTNVSQTPGDRTAPDFGDSESAQRQADRLLLARYSPAAILVDDALNVLQFRGQTAPYLAPASGPPSLNLTRIARPELLLLIPAALQEARDSGRSARRPGVLMEDLGEVNVEVLPITPSGAGGARCFLILLEDEASRRPTRRDRRIQAEGMTESEIARRLQQVERENAELREFFQATMEQHEAAKEELKSAHEEVLSANEEFQSTNEELETSKEELQSANEELTTTNEELRERNQLLAVLNVELEKARAAAERARAYADGIVETVREPLVVLDGQLKVLRVNQAFCAEFNVEAFAIEGSALSVVSNALWDESLNQQLSAVLAQGPAMTDLEVAINHHHRGRRVLSLSARKIVGDADRNELILLAIEDVTERNTRTEALRDSGRRKDEFLAMLAHELRNPLSAITHAIHVLKRGAGDRSLRMQEMIERQTAHLSRLVNELLDVARISKGLIELQLQPVDLTSLVREAAEAARGRLEQRQHLLSLSVPGLPIHIRGDHVRLEQVIANLLENAIKYTEPGGRISIELSEEDTEAVVRVTDNGIGLAPESLERVFDLFTQVDSSLARSSGGLGLGLTVVRRIVELHAGRIEAQSPGLGKGTQFIVRLPLTLTTSTQPQRTTNDRQRPQDNGTHRILIVDDNVDSAEAMAVVFQMSGHEVRLTGSGTAALEVLGSFVPDVAFVDIGLPDINGYELVGRLRAKLNPRTLRIIAVTGYGNAADRERAKDSGFDEHIVKPAHPEQLLGLVAASASTHVGPGQAALT